MKKGSIYKKTRRVNFSDDDFISFFKQLFARKRCAIKGVGKFYIRKVASRETFNNFANAVIKTDEHYILKFKAFDKTNDFINEKLK